MQSELAERQWYALRVRPKFERVAAFSLERKGYQHYLPTYTKSGIELPLFPGFLFARFHLIERLNILLSPGVMSLVTSGATAAAVPEQEIAALQRILKTGVACEPSRLIGIGQPVFVENGPLSGLTGFGLNVRGKYRLILSMRLLQRSVAIEIDRKCVRNIEETGRHQTAFAS